MRIDQLPLSVLQDILAGCPERYWPAAQTRAELVSAVKAALAHAVRDTDMIEMPEGAE